jgi:two-component system OmpR family sensor kinase
MWGTASAVRKHWLEVAWGLFAAANVTVMVGMPRWETIPFHFVWVSLTLLYGFRRWNRRSTVLVVGTVIAVTGAAIVMAVLYYRQERLEELAEIPLMAAMFVLMAWHAERHQAALEEVRRLAETERHMRERERQFVRNASHELRTPITVARGYTELVRSALAGTPRAADADVILDELNRLSRMGERLLLLAAAEHPAFLRRGVVELEPLIVSTVRRWATATPTRRWQVEINAEGSLPGDAERLEAALDALLENAVAFTSEGARIGVTAAAEGETAVIEVSDSGTGIPPEDLDRIFEPFARVARDRSRKNGGTGLGLAIVKAIVDAHGGTITVRSTVGQGSTFCIRLPGFREAPLDAREATPAPLASAVAEG